MADLSPRARDLLAAAHGADEPGPADFRRVRRGVLLRIGSAGFGATVFSLCLQRAQAFLGLAGPKLVAVMALAVGGSAVYQHVQLRPAPPSVISVPARPVHAAPIAVAAPEPVSEPAVVVPVAAPQVIKAALHRPRAALTIKRPAVELEGEMRWVRAADAALRAGNSSAAQGLLEEHAREFPSGALAEEREGLRIVAICQRQAADGKRQAARFLERLPHSLLAGRIRTACSAP